MTPPSERARKQSGIARVNIANAGEDDCGCGHPEWVHSKFLNEFLYCLACPCEQYQHVHFFSRIRTNGQVLCKCGFRGPFLFGAQESGK